MPGPYIFYLFHSTRFHKDKKSKDPHPVQGMQVVEFERLKVRVSKEVQQESMVDVSFLGSLMLWLSVQRLSKLY